MESIENLTKFMNDPVAMLDERFAKYPELKVQKLSLGPKSFVLVFDPKLAFEVLRERTDVFIQNRTIFDRIKPITGENGLVQLGGSASSETRPKFAPMFAASNMIKMKELIAINTQEALIEIDDKRPLDITAFMADLVLRNAFKIFLGLEMKGETMSMACEFQELNSLCGARMVGLLPLPLSIPTVKNRRIKKLRTSLRTKIREAIESSESRGVVNIPMLFSKDEFMIDQCMTFLFAGHETTASSLAFTFLLLGQNPEHCEAIRAGDDALALRVYKEALRLYPPAYMLARESSENCELGGVKIKKGTQVIIGVKQLHHHPDFHQEAHQFKPERFLKASPAFLPFGAGPKDCIGEGVAYMEALTIIKIFCRTYSFSNDQKTIKSHPLVTLHPAPGQMLQVRKL